LLPQLGWKIEEHSMACARNAMTEDLLNDDISIEIMQINDSPYFGFNKSAAYLVFGKDTPQDGHDQPNLGQLQKIGRTQAHFPQTLEKCESSYLF
jgi:hypothetical protein